MWKPKDMISTHWGISSLYSRNHVCKSEKRSVCPVNQFRVLYQWSHLVFWEFQSVESPGGKFFTPKEVKHFMVPPPYDSCRVVRFSGTKLALKGDLKTVEDCILGDFLRILSGLSTISGGSGSGWALV